MEASSQSSFSDWESVNDDDIRIPGDQDENNNKKRRVVLELPPGGFARDDDIAAAAAAENSGNDPSAKASSSFSSFVPVSRLDALCTRSKEPSDDAGTSQSQSGPAPGEDDSQSSFLRNFEILSLSSGEIVRRCKRCTLDNTYDATVCASCSLALVANPNVGVDDQIARQLARKEEEDARTRLREAERKRQEYRKDPLYGRSCILARDIKGACDGSLFRATSTEEDFVGMILEFTRKAGDSPEPEKKISFAFKCTLRSSLESIQVGGFTEEEQPPGKVALFNQMTDALYDFEMLERMHHCRSLGSIPENVVDEGNGGCLCWVVAVLQTTDVSPDSRHAYRSPSEALPLAHFDSSCWGGSVSSFALDDLCSRVQNAFDRIFDGNYSAPPPLHNRIRLEQIQNDKWIRHFQYQEGAPVPAGKPLLKLSVGLIDTYKAINQIYYAARATPRAARLDSGHDDGDYNYVLTPNELVHNGRYRLQKRIATTSFGQVVQAVDTHSQEEVAIKIIKSKKPFFNQAQIEIDLLTHLREKDENDQHRIVRMLSTFVHRNHQCIVFEMLSLNLYRLLENTKFAGVSLNLIRKFAKQLLQGLAYLARPDIDIIHCDIKPENVLLRHPKRSGIKLVDFGSSCKSSGRMYSYIQSRYYRSPEVMLGLPYSVAIDMWSLGCVLVEMHTGEPLFSGTDQLDQMQKIVAILGMVPDGILQQADAQHRLQFFEQIHGRGRWTLIQNSFETGSDPTGIVPSADPIASLKDVVERVANRTGRAAAPCDDELRARQYESFVDLVYRMLAYDPGDRIRPSEALQHPFITQV